MAVTQYALPGANENLCAVSITIASGASASEVVFTGGKALVGILMPSAWTAADLRFKAGDDSTQYNAYDNAGNALKAAVGASEFIAMPLDSAIYAPYITVLSTDTSGVAVNQAGTRTLVLFFRKFLS